MTPKQKFGTLSNRERQVLIGIANGETYKAIASQLGIHFKSVDYYAVQMRNKLGLHCIADLTRFAVAAGAVKLYPYERVRNQA